MIAALTDGSRFSEFKKNFGPNLIAGFSFIHGRLVGLLMNCGQLSAADSQKGGHFVQLCDRRDIPIVFLQNSSGSFSSQKPAECDSVTLKERAKFVQCQSVVRVPKIALNVGGLLGDECHTMCGPAFKPNFYFMWPKTVMGEREFLSFFLIFSSSNFLYSSREIRSVHGRRGRSDRESSARESRKSPTRCGRCCQKTAQKATSQTFPI